MGKHLALLEWNNPATCGECEYHECEIKCYSGCYDTSRDCLLILSVLADQPPPPTCPFLSAPPMIEVSRVEKIVRDEIGYEFDETTGIYEKLVDHILAAIKAEKEAP